MYIYWLHRTNPNEKGCFKFKISEFSEKKQMIQQLSGKPFRKVSVPLGQIVNSQSRSRDWGMGRWSSKLDNKKKNQYFNYLKERSRDLAPLPMLWCCLPVTFLIRATITNMQSFLYLWIKVRSVRRRAAAVPN